MEQAPLWAQQWDKREQQNDTQEIPPEHEKKLLYCSVHFSRLQRGDGVSYTGDIPEPSGHKPVPCALELPLNRGVGPDDPLWSFST